MDTKQIATRLAELCEKNEFEAAQQELYADNVISVEQKASPDFPLETKGKEAVLAKIRKFNDKVEEYFKTTVSGTIISGNSIAFKLSMDIKMKDMDRTVMEEICVYETEDGKVVAERFYM